MIENFKIEYTDIKGLQLIHPFVAYDERGYFMKTYEKEIFREHGIQFENAEDMISCSKKGVLRGLHFQTQHSQDKLVRVVCGEVWDVVVDLRKDSDTYGMWRGFYLSDENKLSLYIPSGFAHGFLAVTDEVVFFYRCGKAYYPEYDTGIRWDDETLQVKWPLERIEHLIISDKDKKLQSFQQFSERLGGL